MEIDQTQPDQIPFDLLEAIAFHPDKYGLIICVVCIRIEFDILIGLTRQKLNLLDDAELLTLFFDMGRHMLRLRNHYNALDLIRRYYGAMTVTPDDKPLVLEPQLEKTTFKLYAAVQNIVYRPITDMTPELIENINTQLENVQELIDPTDWDIANDALRSAD